MESNTDTLLKGYMCSEGVISIINPELCIWAVRVLEAVILSACMLCSHLTTNHLRVKLTDMSERVNVQMITCFQPVSFTEAKVMSRTIGQL